MFDRVSKDFSEGGSVAGSGKTGRRYYINGEYIFSASVSVMKGVTESALSAQVGKRANSV